MESLNNKPHLSTQHARSYTDPQEKARLLAQYAGIFPRNIQEFAAKVVKRKKKIQNFAR